LCLEVKIGEPGKYSVRWVYERKGQNQSTVTQKTAGRELLVARFDAFLKRTDDWKLQKSPRRSIDNGLLVLDQDYSTEASIFNQFLDYRKKGHPWGRMRHVMDVPFFASSNRVSGLQLVDICAYAVRRYLDKSAAAGSHEKMNFQRIFHRFDRDNFGRLHGLRHYVPTGACTCLICQERGHAPAAASGAPSPAAPPEAAH
jgi:hypothetical protein